MDFLPDDIEKYVEEHTSEESKLLKKINRDTYSKVLMPRMLSGHLQGRFLSMISKLVKPKNILEIGTFTGYSTICLAEGLTQDGKLITIDINEELEEIVKKYFDEAGLKDKIEYKIGNALDLLPKINLNFDLVFIDADKENYSRYFDLVIEKVNKGGLILADNVLWSGKVVKPKPDKDTRAILEFNKKVSEDERVEHLLLPLRDGIMMVIKK
jgi:predicted O-methyltransferase YrrM